MSNFVAKNRLPWDDHWTQPSLNQLLNPLKAHHRRSFDNLMEYLNGLEGTQQGVVWYGPAWKWTIHYTLPPAALPVPAGKNGKSKTVKAPAAPTERPTLCYLVPRVEAPLICVPLSDELIAGLPMARLSKFIRDGVKLAKYALATHWCVWSPATQAEVGLVVDLIKRRQKIAAQLAAAANEPVAVVTAPARETKAESPGKKSGKH